MNSSSGKRLVRVVAAVIQNDQGNVLITQRRPEAFLPLKWEFPGGKVEEGETDQQALARELKEELEIDVDVNEHFMGMIHQYPDFDIDFQVYKCAITSGTLKKKGVADYRWVGIDQLGDFDFPPADEPTVKMLISDNKFT